MCLLLYENLVESLENAYYPSMADHLPHFFHSVTFCIEGYYEKIKQYLGTSGWELGGEFMTNWACIGRPKRGAIFLGLFKL